MALRFNSIQEYGEYIYNECIKQNKQKDVCNICNMKFKTTYLLNKHKNKKNPCINDREILVSNKITELKTFIRDADKCLKLNDSKCLYCNIGFSTKGNLKAHVLLSCKIKKDVDIELEKYTTELNKLKQLLNTNIAQLTDQDKDVLIKLLLEKQQNGNNGNNVTNNIGNQQNINNQQITNNITNNVQINLNNFDNPNCDFLTIEQKNKFLKDRYKGLIDFITYVYFNEKNPENHTIMYTNLRSKYGHSYKNNKWIVEEIDLIADKLNEFSFDKLNEHLEEIKNDDETAEKYKKEIDKGLAFVKHFTSNDTAKQTKTDIKKTLYNNKDVIEKNRRYLKN